MTQRRVPHSTAMATPGSPAQSGKASPRSISRRRGNSQPSPSLATIDESAQTVLSPPIPRKSSKRTSQTPPGRVSLPRPWSPSHSANGSTRTGPPAYDWVPDEVEEGSSPVEDEKLAELRRNRTPRKQRRGGWGRLAIIAGIILLCIIGLAVGLGVGLTAHKNGNKNSSGSSSTSSPTSNEPPRAFPLGQYSFVTALQNTSTACVSNPATWQCYPFTTYDPSNSSTASTSMATFNWVINNTASTYANPSTTTSSTSTTNLTISTTTDPFSLLSFPAEPLTYTTDASNSTSASYTFTLTNQIKKVLPSGSLTSNSAQAAVCFFNSTTFVANIYLRAARDFPAASEANSTSIGGYEQWPYAVQLVQTASGGENVPNCYELVDGVPGERITEGIAAQGTGQECSCEWRNY